MIIIDSVENIDKELFFEIQERLHTYKNVLSFISGVLKSGQIVETEEQVGDKIIFIDPLMIVEYQRLKEQEMTFFDCLTIYEEWLNKISNSLLQNGQKFLTNKKLKEHWVSNVKICFSIHEPINKFFGTKET